MEYYVPVLLAIALITLLLAAFAAYKVWRVHLMLYAVQEGHNQQRRYTDQVYRQFEILFGLYRELGFDRTLPGTRGWAASPDFLLELARYALASKPNTVVECGSGVSTLILARCMQLNGRGHVYSLDHDDRFAQKTRENLAYHGLSEWATVIHAPLRPHSLENAEWSWYAEEKLPEGVKIDLLVVDGPPVDTGPLARYPAGPLLFPKLSGTGAVFADDAKRQEEREVISRWKKAYPTAIFEERHCEKGCVVVTQLAA